jgi:hypothetical protein
LGQRIHAGQNCPPRTKKCRNVNFEEPELSLDIYDVFFIKTPCSESESRFGYKPTLDSEKYLDPCPDSVNPHPKHCFKKVITNSDTENDQFLKKNMAPGNYRALH